MAGKKPVCRPGAEGLRLISPGTLLCAFAAVKLPAQDVVWAEARTIP